MAEGRPLWHVRQLVEGLMQRHDLAERRQQDLVGVLWEEIVGAEIARISRPVEMRQGVLFVKVKSPQWAHELTYMKTQVLANLNDCLPSMACEDVRFTAAWTSPGDFVDEAVTQPRPWPRAADLEQVSLPASDRYTVEALLDHVSDPALQDQLRRLLTTEFKSRRWRLAHGWRECLRCGALFYGPGEVCDFCRMESRPA